MSMQQMYEAALRRIDVLEHQLEMAERMYDRLNLCPDHRDKATDRCIACDGERRGREEGRQRA